MPLASNISALATAIANYLRDSVLPRLLPSGGATGQVLAKSSTTSYAVGWTTPAAKGAGADLRALTDDAKFLTSLAVANATAGFPLGSISGTVALNFATNGPNQVGTLVAALTLGQHTLPNATADTWVPVSLELVQPASGSTFGLAANLTYNKFPGGTVFTLSTTLGARDILYGQARLIGGVALVQWTGIAKDVK